MLQILNARAYALTPGYYSRLIAARGIALAAGTPAPSAKAVLSARRVAFSMVAK